MLALVATMMAQEGTESYGGYDGVNSAYEEPSYGTKAAYHGVAPSMCYAGCQGCFNAKTGQCVARAETGYVAMEPAYAAASGSYHRHLSSCPAGSKETSHFSIRSKWMYWVGFAFLFIPALYFLFKAFESLPEDARAMFAGFQQEQAMVNRWGFILQTRMIAGIVCFIASLAYLTMATGHGFVTQCSGRDFYYARYIDWLITTPLMLYDIAKLGGKSNINKLALIIFDVIMIASGLIGGLIEDDVKWAFFGFGLLSFVFLLHLLVNMNYTGTTVSQTGTNHQEIVYCRARDFTALIWLGYPIVWILAEGTGTIGVTAEAVAYTVLDIISKSLLGVIIVTTPWKFATKLTVSGTGYSSVDGEYNITPRLNPPIEDAELFGVYSKPIWRKAGNWEHRNKAQEIQWLGSVWQIMVADGSGPTFLNQNATLDPPTNGWKEQGNANDPLQSQSIITYVDESRLTTLQSQSNVSGEL